MSKIGIGVEGNAFRERTTISGVSFGKNCTFVGNDTFNECNMLSTINDDNNIKTIGNNAFRHTNLTTANFSQLSEIGEFAFENCNILKDFNIGECNIVEKSTFKGCVGLENIDLSNCTEIKESAFESCKSLKDTDLSNCTYIKKSAFKGCESLEKINLSKCTEIKESAFEGCKALIEVYLNDTFCKLEDKNAFLNSDENIKFYVTPSVINWYRTNDNWKYYNDNIKIIIDNNCIVYKTSDEKIVEKNEIESVYKDYISNIYDEKTKTCIIEFENDVEYLYSVLFNGSETIEEVNIPNTCKHIDESAFEDCVNLHAIELPDELNKIGKYAFKNCKSLTYLKLPICTEELGEGIFAGCEKLENVESEYSTYNGRALVYNNTLIWVLPNDNTETKGRIHNISKIDENINKLGDSCFYGCKNLIRVDIPASIGSIGNYAFEKCSNLCEVHFHGDAPPELGEEVFNDVSEDFKIFVPEKSFTTYQDTWKKYESHIYPIAKNSIICYGDNNEEFSKLDKVSLVENNDYVNGTYYKISIDGNELNDNYFNNNSNVQAIIFGEGISTITENGAIQNCENLNYIHLSNSINKLHYPCFVGCPQLNKIVKSQSIN